jgi:hypothetical protein
MTRRLSIRARAWTALLLPPATWFTYEQGLSALLHARCGDTAIGIAWGIVSLALCALAVRVAWPLRHHEGELANPWLARLAIAIAAIFALAVLFQSLALSIVPPCVG